LHCRKGTTVSENDSRMLIHLINVVYVHVLVHLLQRNRTQHFVNMHVFVCQTTWKLQHISQESVTTFKSTALSCLKEDRSEEHTSELQSRFDLVCRLLLEKKKNIK